jgi:uncharacterized protein YbaR (Trm112 family)
MINDELLIILCCPETQQSLSLADSSLIEKINNNIKEGKVVNKDGKIVTEALQGGLIREDRKCLYPIRNDIPILLVDEAIQIE